MKYIALIPSYEPDDKLIKVVKELHESNKFEIILVNDGSNSSYDDIFNKCRDYVTYLRYDENQGKGYALKLGFKYIADHYQDVVVVTMDSDGQHTLKDATNLCDIVSTKDNTMILGKRLRDKKIPFKSKFGNALTRFIYRMSSGIDIYDTQTGLRAFKSDMIPFLNSIDGNRFEYEMNVLLEAPACGIKLEEVVIETIYENNNSGTHFHPIKDSYRIYKSIFKRLFKYIISSIASFFVDYGLYSLIIFLSDNLILANVSARVISSTFNYTLNKNMVFEDKEKVSKSLFKYYLLAIIILSLNTGLLTLAVKVLGWNKYVSKLIIEILLFIISYTVQKKIVFKKKRFSK